MPKQALFAGLVIDEQDRAAEVVYIGDDPCYVVNDNGFHRHIPSEIVDRQVLKAIAESIEGHEDLLSEQTAKMLGVEDPFSFAAIESQLKHIDQQLDTMLQTGIPEEMRAYLGMMGFRIKINVHGDVIEVVQPGMESGDDE
jgi:hypothetical protein